MYGLKVTSTENNSSSNGLSSSYWSHWYNRSLIPRPTPFFALQFE